MIHPPLSQCSQEIGRNDTKSFSTVDRLYKHWNPPTSEWPGNDQSERILRSAVITNTKDYLLTMSACQLQVRVHPK